MSRVALLLNQMDDVYESLWNQLHGLSDREYLWQPIGNCWTVRDQAGQWVTDFEEPDPEPPPFTTIGRRLVHVGDWKHVYHDWAFGPRTLTFPDLEAPSHASGALARLEQGHTLLRGSGNPGRCGDGPARSDELGDSWRAWRIFWTMIDHDAHHGGEIGCLRDFYRATH